MKGIKIKDVKPGMMVYSLNEELGITEPYSGQSLRSDRDISEGRAIWVDRSALKDAQRSKFEVPGVGLAYAYEITAPVFTSESGMLRTVEKDNSKKNSQYNTHDQKKEEVVHDSLLSAGVYQEIAGDEQNTDNDISDEKRVHGFFSGKSLSPSAKETAASKFPDRNVNQLNLSPATLGAKIETKEEPTSNLDKSRKYSDTLTSLASESRAIREVSPPSKKDDISFVRGMSNRNAEDLNRAAHFSSAEWTKVIYLMPGDLIAVSSLEP